MQQKLKDSEKLRDALHNINKLIIELEREDCDRYYVNIKALQYCDRVINEAIEFCEKHEINQKSEV